MLWVVGRWWTSQTRHMNVVNIPGFAAASYRHGATDVDRRYDIPPSFDEVVVRHLTAGYRLARWLVRNDQDAEDVVQEAALRGGLPVRQTSRVFRNATTNKTPSSPSGTAACASTQAMRPSA